MKTRKDLLGGGPDLERFMSNAYRDALKGNSTLGWLRSNCFRGAGISPQTAPSAGRRLQHPSSTSTACRR